MITNKKLLFFLTGFISFNACADVIKNIQYKYYYFTPSSEKQHLNDAAMAVTPIKVNGEKFLGHTHWDIKWHYNYKTHNRKCFLTSHTIKFDATVTLPQLINANREHSAIFQRYMPNLKKHEDNHVILALKHAQNLDYLLKNYHLKPTAINLNNSLINWDMSKLP